MLDFYLIPQGDFFPQQPFVNYLKRRAQSLWRLKYHHKDFNIFESKF